MSKAENSITMAEIARSLIKSDPTLLTLEKLDVLFRRVEEEYDGLKYVEYLNERDRLAALGGDDDVSLFS